MHITLLNIAFLQESTEEESHLRISGHEDKTHKIDTKHMLRSQEATILSERNITSEANKVTTEKIEGIDITNVCSSDEVIYTPVGIAEGSNVNTEVQIIAVNSQENGPMIEGEMIELVIPEDGTDVPNIVTIETSKVKE